MEFTKLSPNRQWHLGGLQRTDRLGDYKGFPPEKNKLNDVDDYVEKAVGRERLIQSSIPEAKRSADEAASSARRASSEVESIRAQLRKAGYIGVTIAIIAVFLPLYFGFYQIHSLISDSNNYVTESRKEINSLTRHLDEKTLTELQVNIELERINSQLQQLKTRTDDQQIKSELERLISQLQLLKDRINPPSNR